MRDVSIEYAGKGKLNEAASAISKLRLDARRLPAWGFFARNVKRVDLQNVRLSTKELDQRHVLIFDRVDTLAADSLRFPVHGEAAAPIVLNHVKKAIWRDLPDDYLPPPRPSQGKKGDAAH